MPGTERERGRALTNFIAIIAATGGLLFGYDTGIISAALLQLTKEFHLTTFSAQIVTGAIIAGALIGCITAAPLSDRMGRRRTVMVAAVLFLIGTVVVTFAHAIWMLIAARLVLGLAIGAASQIVPIYIAEISPPERRGTLVVAFQLAVVLGITVSFFTGYLLRHSTWRLMFGLGMIPATILLIGMIFLPNSPRWMAMTGQIEGARDVLRRVRATDEKADAELQDIIDAHDEQAPLRDLLKPWVRPAVVASVGIALLCQLTGINAVLYYAPTIFAGAGFGESSALLTSVAIGIAMTIATVFGGWAVDVWGRRKLMLRLLPGAVISLIVLGAMFLIGAKQGPGAWVMVAAIVGYTMFNTGSLSVAIWLVGAEVYPLSMRGSGMSLVAASHWGADLIISLTTLSLVQALGAGGTFFLFAVINALALLFVFRYVPETRGRSLEALEASLRDGTFAPAARKSAEVAAE
ncbi:major facilitator superfamily sugar transporter [Neoasaia chiangmaiensis NBRC 101099]|uniref:MFS sugar transporter n=1 Tax=Neoasaia chiangmaiensis TaxID=320497 RepID=A0A1U9KNE3_9PROT|nr:sugar porter family MFS transporter [Neoasaia chiangmaiensis]AQS87331.1 MFS sugar transporter [Neoasaia chiangmaiensis]GBR43087.1 major facilitator superfamily sugar transporter [Neoasaia chiangmaiensis NBRC 101099]GEN16089.1 MFS transporter [Neoasaia chiangmaiensis]